MDSNNNSNNNCTSLFRLKYEASKHQILNHVQTQKWIAFVSAVNRTERDFKRTYDIKYNGQSSVKFCISVSLIENWSSPSNLSGYIQWTSSASSSNSKVTENDNDHIDYIEQEDHEMFDSIDSFKQNLESIRKIIFVKLLRGEKDFALACRQKAQKELDKIFYYNGDGEEKENENENENENDKEEEEATVVRVPPHQDLINAIKIGKYYEVIGALVQYPQCRYFGQHVFYKEKENIPSLLDLTIKNCFSDHPVIQNEDAGKCDKVENLIVTEFTQKERHALKILVLLIKINKDTLPSSILDIFGSVPVEDINVESSTDYITVFERGIMNIDFVKALGQDLFSFEILQVLFGLLLSAEKFWIVQHNKRLGPQISQALLKSLKYIYNRNHHLLQLQQEKNKKQNNLGVQQLDKSNHHRPSSFEIQPTIEYKSADLIWTYCDDILDLHGNDRSSRKCSFKKGALIPVNRLFIYEAVFEHIFRWKNIREGSFKDRKISHLRDLDFKNAIKTKEHKGQMYYICFPVSSSVLPKQLKSFYKMETLEEHENEQE